MIGIIVEGLLFDNDNNLMIFDWGIGVIINVCFCNDVFVVNNFE